MSGERRARRKQREDCAAGWPRCHHCTPLIPPSSRDPSNPLHGLCPCNIHEHCRCGVIVRGFVGHREASLVTATTAALSAAAVAHFFYLPCKAAFMPPHTPTVIIFFGNCWTWWLAGCCVHFLDVMAGLLFREFFGLGGCLVVACIFWTWWLAR